MTFAKANYKPIRPLPSVLEWQQRHPLKTYGYYCLYTTQPLPASPKKGDWLSYLSSDARRQVEKNNRHIAKWLNKYNFVQDENTLFVVPCHRSKDIMADNLVPAGADINPGERKSVVGLWLRYMRLFREACEILPDNKLAELTTRIINCSNVYMRNWAQVAHVVEMIETAIAPFAAKPVTRQLQLQPPAPALPAPPVLALPAPQPLLQLPAVCETTKLREALNAATLLCDFYSQGWWATEQTADNYFWYRKLRDDLRQKLYGRRHLVIEAGHFEVEHEEGGLCSACRGAGELRETSFTNVDTEITTTEVLFCTNCSGTGRPASGLTEKQIEETRQLLAKFSSDQKI